MHLEFTEEQKMLRESVKMFAEKEVAPLAYEIDRDERFPIESFKRLAEMGLLGVTVPAEYGGAGAGYTEMCIIGEELGVVCCSTSATWGAHSDLCVDNIRRNADEYQKKNICHPCVTGARSAVLP